MRILRAPHFARGGPKRIKALKVKTYYALHSAGGVEVFHQGPIKLKSCFYWQVFQACLCHLLTWISSRHACASLGWATHDTLSHIFDKACLLAQEEPKNSSTTLSSGNNMVSTTIKNLFACCSTCQVKTNNFKMQALCTLYIFVDFTIEPFPRSIIRCNGFEEDPSPANENQTRHNQFYMIGQRKVLEVYKLCRNGTKTEVPFRIYWSGFHPQPYCILLWAWNDPHC